MSRQDSLVIYVCADPTNFNYKDGEWFARMEIKCDLLSLLENGFFWSASDNIDFSKAYLLKTTTGNSIEGENCTNSNSNNNNNNNNNKSNNNPNKSNKNSNFNSKKKNHDKNNNRYTNKDIGSNNWRGNDFRYHQVLTIQGPMVQRTRTRTRWGGLLADVDEVVEEPEWTGVVKISGRSYGAISRSRIDQWDHKNIHKITGERMLEDGKMRAIYYFSCYGDRNINCYSGDRRPLVGFWPWPREEHVRGRTKDVGKRDRDDERDVGVADRPLVEI